MARSRLVWTLVVVVVHALALAGAPSSRAQGTIRKIPSGPFVVPGVGMDTIKAGEQIFWTIEVTNPNPFQDAAFTFTDEPQSPECETGGPGAANEDLPQRFQYYEDPAADGTCGALVTGSSTTPTITCDLALQRLTITDVTVPAGGGVATITFSTRVDAAATPGLITCNWAHFFTTTGAPAADTRPPNGNIAACTCLRVSPPTTFDFEATKTAVVESPSGFLVPGDPASTVIYTITARNTGGEDITDGSLDDRLPPEGEWVGIVDCPAPLTCEIDPADSRHLSVTGYDLPSTDPDTEVAIQVRAMATCEAATDDDTGVLCNQGTFQVMGGGSFPTDDPGLTGPADPTCLPVAWSDLRASSKFLAAFEDNNPLNGVIDRGEYVTFVIRVRNDGRLPATNVEVRDDVGAFDDCFNIGTVRNASAGATFDFTEIVWNIPSVPPLGGEVDVSFEVQLSGTEATCCNHGFVNSQERRDCGQASLPLDDSTTAPLGDPTCITPGPPPALEVEKTVAIENDTDPLGAISPGDDLRWTVTVTNVGVGTATAITLVDTLPICLEGFPGPDSITTTDSDGEAGIDASRPSTGFDPGEVRVTELGGTDGIPTGETVTITWVTTLLPSATCCNQASVTYRERGEAELSDDPGTLGVPHDPTCLDSPPLDRGMLSKAASLVDLDADGSFEVGERIDYVLVFTNTGNTDLSNIVVTDTGRACLAFQPSPFSIDPPGGGTIAFAGNDWTATIPGPLPPAGQVTIRVTALAAVAGACCNQASWTCDQLPAGGLSDAEPATPAVAQETCHFSVDPPTESREGRITKAAFRSDCTTPVLPTDCLVAGETICYLLRVENVGTLDLTYDLTDTLPTLFRDRISAAPPLTYSRAANTLSTRSGPLAVGASEQFQYTVRMPCDPGGSGTNTVRITFASATGSLEQRTASATVSWGLPDLRASTKTWDEAVPSADADDVITDAGELVLFTITACNDLSAACTALGVVVTDVLEPEIDAATVDASSEGGVFDVALRTIRWDSAGTPALDALDPGECVTLTATMEIDAAIPPSPPRLIPNKAVVEATGNSIAGCVAPPADLQDRVAASAPLTASPRGNLAYGGLVAGRQDLLINDDPTSLMGAMALYRASVFDSPSANATTCGTNGLDAVADVSAYTDVELLLAGAGVAVPRSDARVQGPIVFFQVTERCERAIGGNDDPLCLTKTATDYVLRSSATPDACP